MFTTHLCELSHNNYGDIMGCPMCSWRTAILMVAGIAILFMAIPYNLIIGLSLMGAAWVWSMWPKKSCAYTPGEAGDQPQKQP